MGEQMPKYYSFETVGDQGDTEGHVGEKSKDHGEYFTVAGKCETGLFVVEILHFRGKRIGLTKTPILYRKETTI